MSPTQALGLDPGLVLALAPEVDHVEAVWITPLSSPIASLPAVPVLAPAVSLNSEERKRRKREKVKLG